jgi:6-phosphogluconolactonase
MSLCRAAVIAATILTTASLASATEYWVYLGTYTSKDGSKGIYRSKFDTTTGKLAEPELAAELTNPTFLAIHPNGKSFYAVGETGGKDGGGVFAFALDRKTGQLTRLNQLTTGGAGPCHIVVSPDGNYVAVANYGGGSSALFTLEPDGKLGKRIGFAQHKGSSVNTSRQEGPHAHCVSFGTKGNLLGSVDLGIDKVKMFKIDPQTGLVPVEQLDIPLPPGSGPRHIANAPDAPTSYVNGELDSTVNVVQGGKVVQTLSTLPEPVKGNTTAECILSPDGKFVYVSNRGHNSIAVFKVGEDKKLTAVGHITGDITIPRNFNIEPTGKWMLIASQDGNKVGVWELDPKTGLAKETGTTIKVSRPVCVKFVAVEK